MSFANSNSSRSSSKRKRLNQAPSGNRNLVGMAWGANSSSSKNSVKKKRPAAFTDFGGYMSEKERKLRLQFHSDAENSLLKEVKADSVVVSGNASGSKYSNGLFSGISIFVDGFTIPSNQELRNYMIEYGGGFENYFSRDRVTHIICSNLPDSKIKNLRSFSRGLPVVKPQWIVDSVAANKILPVATYQLERLANNCPQQQRLSAFFTVKSNPLPDGDMGMENKSASISCNQGSSLNGPEETVERKKNYDCTPQAQFFQENSSALCGAQEMHGREENCIEESSQMLNSTHQVPCSLNLKEEYYLTDHRDVCSENEITRCNTSKLANSESTNNSVNKACKEISQPWPSRTKHTLHSTMGDANFVENYFKNSRLHFIGTWKNRYRKRFAGKSFGDIPQGSGVDTTFVPGSRVIVHIDMDCFFVSVVTKNRPELDGKPAAVCHSDNPEGTAEISSANYPARGYGIRAGMFVRDAKALCPHLVILPYDFGAYEEVADQFYDILHKHCNKIQVLSCDEAYLDMTGSGDPDHTVSAIREEVFDVTKCTASAGIAGNLLMARMATKKAKPNGQYHIPSNEEDQFLADLPIGELPGVGYALQEKLNCQNIYNCNQLRSISKEALQRDFGFKTGNMLWHYSRGIDHRQVQTAQDLKSIGAEVNWGVRFTNLAEVHHFLMNLSREVSLRLQDVAMQGRTFTLKVKKRKKGAGEPAKFMGCGTCDNLSHSVTVPSATDNIDILLRISRQIFASFNLDVREVRGIGLQVSRLEAAESHNQGAGKNALKSWLASKSKMTLKEPVLMSNEERSSSGQDNVEETHGLRKEFGSAECYYDKVKGKEKIHESNPFLPHISRLDPEVLASLPPEILSEISDVYNIEVVDYSLGKHRVSERYDIAKTNAMEKFSAGTGSKRQEIKFPILEGCGSKVVRSGSKNIDCDNQHMILKREEEEQHHDSAANRFCSVDLPASSELDPSVLSALPLSLRLEIEQQYRHKSYVEKKNAPVSHSREEMGNQPQFLTSNPGENIPKMFVENSRTLTSYTSDSRNISIGKVGREASRDDLVSMSMSQLDITVLEELPADMQRDILDSILAQRPSEASHEEALLCKRENSFHTISGYDEVEQKVSCVEGDALFEKRLWKGNPPEWVKQFKLSNCILLKLIAECYKKAGSTQSLSSVLLYLVSSLPEEFLSWSDLQEESVRICSDLFKQYIEDKLESDIEEIYICFRILKRLLPKSNFWMTVYNTIFPFLQASVGEIYGGDLKL